MRYVTFILRKPMGGSFLLPVGSEFLFIKIIADMCAATREELEI